MKNGAYLLNLDEYESVGTYRIALHVNGYLGTSNDVTYFDSFLSWKYSEKNLKNYRQEKDSKKFF